MVTNEPVLLIAFNRPDHLIKVIDRLREVKPSAIYFAVDGARADRLEEKSKVDACRALVAAFDWPCEVKILFHDT
ncbi:MAG: nucleotide-diphospho-sugar transferase, partial [Actinomycetes bacterium]